MVRIYILSIIAWSSISLTFPKDVPIFNICRTPSNDTGLCVQLSNCENIKNMIMKSKSTSEELLYLRQSQCGYNSGKTELIENVLVCCPKKYCKNCGEVIPGDVLPQAGVCGIFLEDKIYGGNQTALDEFPWMALLQYKRADNTTAHLCGGSLINSRYVITAAHCVSGEIMEYWDLHRVRLGEWDQNTNPDCIIDKFGVKKECALPHIDIAVEHAIAHELYDPNANHRFYDIALIRLAQYVSYNIFVRPICLPLAQELRNSQFENRTMEISGWGQTSIENIFSPIKLKANIKGWSFEKCQQQYKLFRDLNDKQLCAGGETGVDTCTGDSGGPIMIKEKLGKLNVYLVAGITSYGPTPCGLRGWPAVYTKMGKFVDWLQDKLKP